MNINLTIIGQTIAMVVFVWFCMKFIWPHILQALEQRRATIAEGLASSEKAEKALEEANQQAEEILSEARGKAGEVIEQASQRANQIVEKAKQDAIAERDRQVAAAEAEIRQASNQAREVLRTRLAALAVSGAERVLEKEIDEGRHKTMIDELATEL